MSETKNKMEVKLYCSLSKETGETGETEEIEEIEEIEYSELDKNDKDLVTKEIQCRLNVFLESKDYSTDSRDAFRYLMGHGGEAKVECDEIIFYLPESSYSKNVILNQLKNEADSGYFNSDGDSGVELSKGYYYTYYDTGAETFNDCEFCHKILIGHEQCNDCIKHK
jgi:hypothetical protein